MVKYSNHTNRSRTQLGVLPLRGHEERTLGRQALQMIVNTVPMRFPTRRASCAIALVTPNSFESKDTAAVNKYLVYR